MEIIGITTLGDEVHRVLGGVARGCTVTGNAVDLEADLWQGGRVSAVGTEGTVSASITHPDGTVYDSDRGTTYAVDEKQTERRGRDSNGVPPGDPLCPNRP